MQFKNMVDAGGAFCRIQDKGVVNKITGNEEYLVETKLFASYGHLTIPFEEDTNHFFDMNEEDQEKIIAWITDSFIPRKTFNESYSSYGLKQTCPIYVTNNQFKEAMLCCGFYPKFWDTRNWNFNISNKSPNIQARKAHPRKYKRG